MPKDQQEHAKSRKRPVSCHFCRTRKLRCSRTAPCLNCVSRRITCDLEAFVAPASSEPVIPENTEVIERLRRVEELLLAQKGEEQVQNSHPPDVPESRQQLINSLSSPAQIPNLDMENTAAWPGSVAVDHIPSNKVPRSQIVFRTCPVGEVTEAQSYVYTNEFHSTTNSELSRCIWLPPRYEAQLFLEKFIRVAHNLPYVTHIPSLPSVLEQVYAKLGHQSQINLGRVTLLLSIFAAATYSWVQSDCAYGIFSSSQEANSQALLWIRGAEDVLDIACRSSKVSIEGVQGAINIGFVAALVDGLHRYRLLFGMSVVLARDLGLHRIDHPSNASMANTAQAEIGRRVWWYLCASDWVMAARVGGMYQGTHTCNPRQMITKKPLNINDEEVFDGMSRDGRPLSQPTTMSYTIQSIRLAEVSRSIIDRSPLAMAYSGEPSYDSVMDTDTELQTLINEVPAFYSMSKSVLMGTHGVTQTQAENIVSKGKITYLLIYLHRCKLHLPYFPRGWEDSAYYSSREICIKYARLIIQSELWQENSDVEITARFKFTALLVGVFLACIVLLMDLCVNPLSPQYEKQREEVYKAFKIIEEAKNESETTAKSVDSIVDILRKYQVSPLKSNRNQQQQHAAVGVTGGEQQPQGYSYKEKATDISVAPGYDEYGDINFSRASHGQFGVNDGHGPSMEVEGLVNEAEGNFSSYWTDFTQSFEQGVDVNSFDWEHIFSELDSSFI